MHSNLNKLSKTQLLKIIYDQEVELNDLKQKLEDKTLQVKEAGSIAQASLQLNKIFEDAQKAADQYLENIKSLNNAGLEKDVKQEEIIEIEPPKKKRGRPKKDKNNKLVVANTSLIPICETKNIKFKIQSFKELIKSYINNLIIERQKKKIKKKLTKNLISKDKIFLTQEDKKAKIYNSKNFKNTNVRKIAKEKFKNNPIYLSYLKLKRTKTIKTLSQIKPQKKAKISLNALEKEIKRRDKRALNAKLLSTLAVSSIIVVAVSIIIATKFLNILQVSGNSMEPNLYENQYLVASKYFDYEKGDMIAFYYNDNVLIKRVIATQGDIVDIDDIGNVYVNSVKIEEPYVINKSLGNTNISFPFRVQDKEVFVLGDNRDVSLDSRNKAIGTINEDRIIGKVKFKLFPFTIY